MELNDTKLTALQQKLEARRKGREGGDGLLAFWKMENGSCALGKMENGSSALWSQDVISLPITPHCRTREAKERRVNTGTPAEGQ